MARDKLKLLSFAVYPAAAHHINPDSEELVVRYRPHTQTTRTHPVVRPIELSDTVSKNKSIQYHVVFFFKHTRILRRYVGTGQDRQLIADSPVWPPQRPEKSAAVRRQWHYSFRPRQPRIMFIMDTSSDQR